MTSANQDVLGKPKGVITSPPVTCYATGRWGKFPTFLAKVGSGCSHLIMVKRAPHDRKFYVGQLLQYCVEETLAGMSTGCTPKWKRGSIWKIENDMLYVA